MERSREGRASLRQRFVDPLFEEVDAASLVFFRVGFGVIMLVECWRFWSKGWIERYYIQPEFFFKYYGFEWVQPWAGEGMYWHFGLLAALSLLVALGAFYRIAAIGLFLAFTYVFLLDQARYLNHFYLVILVAFLLVLVPANRAYALDAPKDKWQKATVPGWSVWLFRLQFEVMYIYAGIVKINADWLRLEPLGMWLAAVDDPFFSLFLTQDWVVAIAAYGSIALHVIGAPLLLFRRTRIPTMVVYFAFHLANHFLFQIGIFPWLAMAGTLMFLEPDWPRRAWRWARDEWRAASAVPGGRAGLK